MVMKCNAIRPGLSNQTTNNDSNNSISQGDSGSGKLNLTEGFLNGTDTNGQQSPPINISLIIIIVASCLGFCCTICTFYFCYKCYRKHHSKNNSPTIVPFYLQKPEDRPTHAEHTPIPGNSVVRKLTYKSPVKESRHINYGIERSNNMYRTPNIIVDDEYNPYDDYAHSIPQRRYIIDRNYTEIPRTRTMRRMYPSYTEY
jgi:hypothetical protein